MAVRKPVYDNYEISGCWRIGDGTDAFVETCDDADAQFWTLYGHIDGQGVEAIGDFSSREAAEAVYFRITGQDFIGSYESDDRLRLMHAAPRLLAALQTLLDRMPPYPLGGAGYAEAGAQAEALIAEVLPAHVVALVEEMNGGFAPRETVSDPPAPATGPFDQVAAIMAYEAGELGEAATLELFQQLVDSGLAWQLQGSYGRTARDLLAAGLIHAPEAQPLPSPSAIIANPAAYLPDSATGNDHDSGNEM